MSDIEQIKAMLDRLASQGDISTLKEPLGEIAQALTDMCVLQERPGEEAQALATALAGAFKGLSFPINVNPTPITVQPAQVNVAAPNVTVQAAPQTVTGWVLTVKSRDGNGAIREVSIKPEN